MFDRLKKIVSDGAERVAEYSKSGPANLATVPPVPSGALSAIDLAAASAYLGLQVESIEPLVHGVPDAPYVSYFRGGVLGARGRAHEVVVRSNELRTNKMKEALAAIAALSLRSLEG